MEMTIGNIEVKKPQAMVKRMSLMLWGASGCGKTTLAATAPGKKLWINFDPDGTEALNYFEDIVVMDLSAEPDSLIERFKEPDPFKISKFIAEHNIDTVVFDSLTTFGSKALVHGVAKAQGTAKGRSSTLEDPGYAGYGNKNVWTNLAVMNMLKMTKKFNTHMIFIAHEDKPEKNQDGAVMYISIMLGSSLTQQIPVSLSEIWAMEDTGKVRRIAVRPCRARKPMKTRMFSTDKEPEFLWKYDAETGKGEGIETWYKRWVKNGGKKIEIPK